MKKHQAIYNLYPNAVVIREDVAYDKDGKQYFVTRDGVPVEDETFTPFTDDDGNQLDENGNVISGHSYNGTYTVKIIDKSVSS